MKLKYCLHVVKNFADLFFIEILVSAFVDMINNIMPEKFQRNRWSRSPQLKIVQNKAVKLFWDFKYKLLWGRTSHRFEFSGQVIYFQCSLILKTKVDWREDRKEDPGTQQPKTIADWFTYSKMVTAMGSSWKKSAVIFILWLRPKR